MKRIIIIIIILLATCSNSIQAQQPLDTIYANNKKNVALFFKKPIRQGITGSENFVFTYNRENEQYFGLLQANPGEESNLLTITNDGKVYTYILKYKEKLSKLNYFITEKESIGTEMPILKLPEIKNEVYPYSDREVYFKQFSDYLLKSTNGHISTKRKKGIKLQLQEMVYKASEVYLVIEIKNNSGIDFEMDYLNVYNITGNKRRKASYQRLIKKAIYKHEMPAIIKNNQSQRFVYVFQKFVPDDDEKLQIELHELKGSRNIILKKKI